MSQHITCRIFRGGPGEDTPFRPDVVTSALAAGQAVWIDVREEVTDSAAELENLLATTLGSVIDKTQFETGRLASLGKPPKVKVFDDADFLRLYAMSLPEGATSVTSGEIHVLCGRRFLVTVRYVSGGVAPELPAEALVRWDRSHGRVAEQGGRFLLFSLLEEMIDDYLDVVQTFDGLADELESKVLDEELEPVVGGAAERHRVLQRQIVQLKHDLGEFRRMILPYGEAKELTHEQHDDEPDFREVAEGILRVMELVDNVRELVTSTFEAEQAQVSVELNENMKKITSWGAILLVPTLIAGIYGMNFDEMPELRWGLGYPGALLTMIVSAAALYLVFKKKEWL